jgi:transposase
VKAYVKRNKNDAADAEAICEAVQRPTMRFVPVKTAEQQAALLLHRGRERLVRQRTALVNALRAHLAEYGVIAPLGLRNVGRLIAIIRDEIDTRLPAPARQVLEVLATQVEQLEQCRSVGDRASPPAAKPGRGSGLGEQDGTHRLGGDAPAGELPAYGRSGINPKLRTRACEKQ